MKRKRRRKIWGHKQPTEVSVVEERVRKERRLEKERSGSW